VRFLASSRDPRPGSPSRWFPRHRRLPSLGFCNPSTVFTPRRLAGLFHPARTSRLLPPGVLPRWEQPRFVIERLPSCGYRRQSSRFRASCRRLHFRAFIPSRVRRIRFTVKQIGYSIPSWAFPSSRPASFRPWPPFRVASPLELRRQDVLDVYRWLLRVLTGQRMGSSLARRPAFLRSLAFSYPHAFGSTPGRAYRFASEEKPRHRSSMFFFDPF